VDVEILADDEFEATEDFVIVLENPVGGAYICDGFAQALIADASLRPHPQPRRISGRHIP